MFLHADGDLLTIPGLDVRGRGLVAPEVLCHAGFFGGGGGAGVGAGWWEGVSRVGVGMELGGVGITRVGFF